MILNYIIIIFGFIISFILFHKFPTIKRTHLIDETKVSVIIPIRNEENNIDNILDDLENQTFPLHEIICIDDNSTDKSASIIKKHDVNYVLLDSLKQGWKGKPWACQNGALEASGDLLLFVDADVRLSKDAVASLVSHYKKVKTPISVQPYHNVKKRHELLSLFFNFIQVCVTYLSVFKKDKYVGFYGPVLFIERKVFLDNGGYEPVKNHVVEDLYLGKYYKKKGIDVDLLLGGNEIQFTMYPKGFFQLLEGWAKNFSQASVSISMSLFLMVFLWISYIASVPVQLYRVVYLHNTVLTVVFTFLYILTVVKLYVDSNKIGSFPLFVCILYPLYLLAFILIYIYSIFSTFFFKTTTWKGRRL